MKNDKAINLIVTGVGGQGNVLAARLLGMVALEEGYEATVGDVYGLTQRGGSVASHVRWTRGNTLPPLVPRASLHVLVGFEPLEALRVLTQFGTQDTVAIVNNTPVMPIGVQTGRFEYPPFKALEEGLRTLTRELRIVAATSAARRVGEMQALNMVMMGALAGSGFTALRTATFEKMIPSLVPERLAGINLLAFREGMKLTCSRAS
ncbi:MAG: indolepyruvate oxidoreductase subunit beta [Dehalococcoidia bacterium]